MWKGVSRSRKITVVEAAVNSTAGVPGAEEIERLAEDRGEHEFSREKRPLEQATDCTVPAPSRSRTASAPPCAIPRRRRALPRRGGQRRGSSSETSARSSGMRRGVSTEGTEGYGKGCFPRKVFRAFHGHSSTSSVSSRISQRSQFVTLFSVDDRITRRDARPTVKRHPAHPRQSGLESPRLLAILPRREHFALPAPSSVVAPAVGVGVVSAARLGRLGRLAGI